MPISGARETAAGSSPRKAGSAKVLLGANGFPHVNFFQLFFRLGTTIFAHERRYWGGYSATEFPFPL